MKEEDLINKLENLETPEVDLPGHRQALRAALINSDRFQRRTAMGWARILAPVAAAVALISFFGFVNLIQPELHTTRAMEVARSDAQVQALMAEYGLAITEVRLQDGEAFVLLAPRSVRGHSEDVVHDIQPTSKLYSGSSASRTLNRLLGWVFPHTLDEQRLAPTPEGEVPPDAEEPFRGYVLRVDLAEKTVSGFLEIDHAAVLREMDLTEAHFTESALPRDIGGEEPDPDV